MSRGFEGNTKAFTPVNQVAALFTVSDIVTFTHTCLGLSLLDRGNWRKQKGCKRPLPSLSLLSSLTNIHFFHV